MSIAIPRLVRRAVACAAITSLAGLAAQEKTTTAPPAARFDWPIPGKVVITDTALKDGKAAKMRYTLKTVPQESGEGFRVQHRDFAFLEVNGLDATTPQLQKMLAPALLQASAIPDYLISTAGAYQKTVGLEEMIDRIMPLMAENKSAAETEQMRQMLRQPQMQEILQSALANYWNAWVGAWIGWDIPSGESHETDTELPFAKVMIPAKLLATHHGAVEGRPGYVRLSIITKAEGDEVLAAMIKMLSSLAAPAPGAKRPEDSIGSVDITNRIEVITRLDDLRPLWVKTEKLVSVYEKGNEKPRTRVERHEYEFDWGDK